MHLDSLRPSIADPRDVVATALPDLAEEVDGLAAGVGVDRDAAWLLQLRRELLGYSRVTSGDCTTYASVRRQPVLAQTVDLREPRRQIALLAVSGRATAPWCSASPDSWATSVSMMLESLWASTWFSAVNGSRDCRHTWRSACAGQRRQCRPGRRDTVRASRWPAQDRSRYAARTGPCVSKLWARNEALLKVMIWRMRITSWTRVSPKETRSTSSPRTHRRDVWRQFGRRHPNAGDTASHHRLLSTPPIFVPGSGDIRRERTVAAVILRPDLGEIRLWPGDPSTAKEQVHSL